MEIKEMFTQIPI